LSHRRENFRQGGFGAEFLGLFYRFGLGLEARETFFEGDGEKDDWVVIAVFFDSFRDFKGFLFFCWDVVFFAKIN
jgi:hypothetical protein